MNDPRTPRRQGIVAQFVWLLPNSKLKRGMLRRLGHTIASTAVVKPCVVRGLCKVTLEERAVLRFGNVIRNVRAVHLEEGAILGAFNYVSASGAFIKHFPTGPYSSLRLKKGGKVASRHTFDCSALVEIGEFSSVAGHGTTFLTHSTDTLRNDQVARPIRVGPRSFVGTHALLLGGSELPAESILAAGAVLTRKSSGPAAASGLWAGVPARWVKDVKGEWFYRTSTRTTSVFDPVTNVRVEDAF